MAPQRTCVVCRRRRDDAELRRAGHTPTGAWYLGRGVGRGVWWCPECTEEIRVNMVQRALRESISDASFESFRQLLNGGTEKVVVVEE